MNYNVIINYSVNHTHSLNAKYWIAKGCGLRYAYETRLDFGAIIININSLMHMCNDSIIINIKNILHSCQYKYNF